MVRSCYGKVLQVIDLHDFRCYLHVASRSLETSVICQVFMHWFGYVFKSPSICFQRTKYEINRDVVYLHSTLFVIMIFVIRIYYCTCTQF